MNILLSYLKKSQNVGPIITVDVETEVLPGRCPRTTWLGQSVRGLLAILKGSARCRIAPAATFSVMAASGTIAPSEDDSPIENKESHDRVSKPRVARPYRAHLSWVQNPIPSSAIALF